MRQLYFKARECRKKGEGTAICTCERSIRVFIQIRLTDMPHLIACREIVCAGKDQDRVPDRPLTHLHSFGDRLVCK